MAVDPGTILSGYQVYAHEVDASGQASRGQFVGVVQGVLDHQGAHYVHVRGGLENANQLFLPVAAVRGVVGKEVHLNLSLQELAGQAWHLPPSGKAD